MINNDLVSDVLQYLFVNDKARTGILLSEILKNIDKPCTYQERFDLYSLVKLTNLIDDKWGQAVSNLDNRPVYEPYFTLNGEGISIHLEYKTYKRYLAKQNTKRLISSFSDSAYKFLTFAFGFATVILGFFQFQYQKENTELKDQIKKYELKLEKQKEQLEHQKHTQTLKVLPNQVK